MDGLEQVDDNLHGRALDAIGDALDRHARDLASLRELARSDGDGAWDKLRELRRDSSTTFRESLAFMQGALARREGLDRGLCRIADSMLLEVSGRARVAWNRLTILDQAEFVQDLSQIIRIRFPEVSVWSLPIATHELGHFVAPRIEVQVQEGKVRRLAYPFQELLENLLDRDRERGATEPERFRSWSFMHEHIADVFAVVAGGPGYVCATILHRFDPSTAGTDTLQHPSGAKRAHMILRTLAEMDRAPGLLGEYTGLIDHLRGTWARSVSSAGGTPELAPEDEKCINEIGDELYGLFQDHAASLLYRTVLRAKELRTNLLSGEQPAPADGDTVTDAVNAAWLARVGSGDDGSIGDLGERAFRLCEAIVGEEGR
ncbi:MAG TPA: hypothetical protein VF058_12055 [Actinomycetota bacterium]